MKYKNNVLDKLNQVEAISNRIQLQVNRNMDQEQILESIESIVFTSSSFNPKLLFKSNFA